VIDTPPQPITWACLTDRQRLRWLTLRGAGSACATVGDHVEDLRAMVDSGWVVLLGDRFYPVISAATTLYVIKPLIQKVP